MANYQAIQCEEEAWKINIKRLRKLVMKKKMINGEMTNIHQPILTIFSDWWLFSDVPVPIHVRPILEGLFSPVRRKAMSSIPPGNAILIPLILLERLKVTSRRASEGRGAISKEIVKNGAERKNDPMKSKRKIDRSIVKISKERNESGENDESNRASNQRNSS